MTKKIYLDNAASTRVDPQVFKVMQPYFSEEYGNASSLHYTGLDNRVAVDRAQAQVAGFLGCDKAEVYFTSGATESDNMAILGVTEAIRNKLHGQKIHVITTKYEHDAVLETCQELEKRGVEVTYLSPNRDGLISVSQLQEAIKPETVLVSIMYVNNEIGTILPITEFGEVIAKENQERKNYSAKPVKIYFHTDATQALNACDCNVNKLGVDLLSLSGHKIHGPKGIGVLYLKKGTPFKPIMFGGHQQGNIRPGTYNVSGIVGLGKAVEVLSDKDKNAEENKKIKELRDYLVSEVTKKVNNVLITGGMDKRVPSSASFIFLGAEGESLLLMLSEKGIAVSTGSACSSGSLEPSHVLMAIGIKPEEAHGSLRVTLSRFTEKDDINAFIEEIGPIVEKLRAMSPLK